MKKIRFIVLLSALWFSPEAHANVPATPFTFYSSQGRERAVSFRGTFRTNLESLADLSVFTEDQRKLFARDQIEPTLKFLFGPLTNRALGSPQRGSWVEVDWESAALVRGTVQLRYEYQGVWIVNSSLPDSFRVPVPMQQKDLFTTAWKNCTDSAPEHQTESFYWYFWDPQRRGCDQREGEHFEIVTVQLGAQTPNETNSFPEYPKLLRSNGQENRFQLTFAFGYVEDPVDPDPERDWDAGVHEYREFVALARNAAGREARETAIYQRDYRGSSRTDKIIGHRFAWRRQGVDLIVNVVAAAGIDQMELFAKSFAHDHDTFFGWFGHSRVGSGFDAERFWRTTVRHPEYYSVIPDYQLVYWGGCNSYSYYTLPFFEFKAHVANGSDPSGTKGLDIIANGLPSYFHLNADNAGIVLGHLLRWEAKPSYQTIVNDLEARARRSGIDVLVAVLGDEDNQ